MKETKAHSLRKALRASLIGFGILTVVFGIVYPISVTIAAQALFPYEANGEQIVVTLPDGTKKVYGSELIGQEFDNSNHLIGRMNFSAPTNLSPQSDEFKKRVQEKVYFLTNIDWTETIENPDGTTTEVLHKNAGNGFSFVGNIPSELVTSSGSGVDPHISPSTAYYQITSIADEREKEHQSNETINSYSEEAIKQIVDKYTERKFLGLFGQDRVNVLLVNLALDGLL